MGQERAGAEWQSSNNSRYTAVEHGNVFHRRNVLLFPIVQIQSDRGVMNLHLWIPGCVCRTGKGECRKMIAAYQRISRADGDLGKDGKDKSNSILNSSEYAEDWLRYKISKGKL